MFVTTRGDDVAVKSIRWTPTLSLGDKPVVAGIEIESATASEDCTSGFGFLWRSVLRWRNQHHAVYSVTTAMRLCSSKR